MEEYKRFFVHVDITDCVSSNLSNKNELILEIDLRIYTAFLSYYYYLVQNDRNAPKHFLIFSWTGPLLSSLGQGKEQLSSTIDEKLAPG